MTDGKEEVFQYRTSGTCSQMIGVSITGNIINDVEFLGGCQGNLTGIRSLVRGMSVDEVIERLSGIQCGNKGTSCPDQLAQCLIEYKNRSAVAK
ncbi:MAG: TIGR03905 family TSCPD domain-containing protein [Candidatus Gastranaerophilales bacterium]|nr:TIGR03905 family TSCPD domain-containing protein [Candidatus Gastranaerophilales bacterium]